MKVFYYYYYYLIYRKFRNNKDAHLPTVFGISFCESFIINGIIQILLAYFFCYKYSFELLIGISIVIVLCNFIYFKKSNYGENILQVKPLFFSNNVISIILMTLFLLLGIIFIFSIFFVDYIVMIHCKQ